MKTLIVPLLLIVFGFSADGPLEIYKTNQAQSSLKIQGTSTMHDWEISANNFEGIIDVEIFKDSVHIKDLRLSVLAKSLKSGKAPMDANTYKALKAEDHPKIEYRFTKIRSQSLVEAKKIKLVAEGQLTVAGKTKTLAIPLTALVGGNGIELSGQTRFKMTQFDVEPPSFMFGTVTTGDEVTILFNIKYN